MRRVVIVAVNLGWLAGLGCQMGPAQLTQDQRVAIADTAAGVVQRVFTAANQLDAKGLVDAYATDAVMAENGVIYSTKEAYRAALDSAWQGIQGINSRPSSVRTMVAASDVAVVMAPFVFTITAKSGRQVTGQGVLTALVQRRDQRWQIIRSHESEAHLDQLMQQLMQKGGRR
ncbi:MAG TPA: nuclear transport factor 2 family protein [Gemmatimonadales bacterium]|nr:nuclear transport factor 2 family protein [Gemmatimonadales bacterium]